MVLTVGYDIESADDKYTGQITTDHYGRKVPKSAHGSINLGKQTSSTRIIIESVTALYDRIVDKNLLVRRMYVVANHIVSEREVLEEAPVQLDLFTDYEALKKRQTEEEKELAREKEIQKAMLKIKKRYGKNAILKGMNLQEGATTIERNGQVGGHKA